MNHQIKTSSTSYPSDFKYIPRDQRFIIKDGYETVTRMKLWKQLQDPEFNPTNKYAYKITENTEYTHSTNTATWLCGHLEYIAKHGLDEHEKKYRKMCEEK